MSAEADIRQHVAQIQAAGAGLTQAWSSTEPPPAPVPELVAVSAPRRSSLWSRLMRRR